MIPARAPLPFHRAGWVYEEKVDGFRMLAVKDGSRVRLLSRRGYDMGERFPGIVAGLKALPAPSLVLDGEVAVFDEGFVSHLGYLMGRPLAVEPRRRGSGRSGTISGKSRW